MAIDRTWYNTLVDDDGSNTLGTLWNKAAVDSLLDAVDVLADTVPAALTTTGTVNDWAPGLLGHTFTQWNGAADLTVTGLAGGLTGQRWTFVNVGAKVASFPHQSGSSAAGNRWFNSATSGATPVAPGGYASWIYHGSTWVLIAHEQGATIAAPYSAAYYSANVGTFGVDAGDVVSLRYRLSGRTLTVSYMLNSVSVSGSPTTLFIANGAWGSFTTPYAVTQAMGYLNDGAILSGYAQTAAGGVSIALAKTSGAAFSTVTNTGYVQGTISFEVN